MTKWIRFGKALFIGSQSASLQEESVALVKENADLKQLNLILGLQLAQVRHRLDELLRRRYGISSEKIDPAQLQLILEGLQSDERIEQLEQPEPEEEEAPENARPGKTEKKRLAVTNCPIILKSVSSKGRSPPPSAFVPKRVSR